MNPEPHIPPRPDGFHPAPVASSRPDAGPPGGRKATWSWLEGLGVYVIAFLMAGLATLPVITFMEEDADLTNIVITMIAALVIIGVLATWLSMRHRGWLQIMGLPAAGAWLREIGAGVLFGLGLYPVMVFIVGGILISVLHAITGEPVKAPEQVPEQLSTVGTALTVLYAVVVAPIGEELFFRGILFRAIRDRHGFWIGALGSGLGFGLIHFIPGSGVDAALLMTVMFFTGMALCYIYERRGTIVAPIAAHITFNVIGITLILGLR